VPQHIELLGAGRRRPAHVGRLRLGERQRAGGAPTRLCGRRPCVGAYEVWGDDTAAYTLERLDAPGTVFDMPGRPGGLGCPSPTRCVAVANDLGGGPPRAFRWDGTTWSEDPVDLAPRAPQARIGDLDCPAADRCYLASLRTDGDRDVIVIHRWDGAAWTELPAPGNLPDTSTREVSLSCPTIDVCALAQSAQADVSFSRVHLWDGASWQIGDVFSTGSGRASVECTSATWCIRSGPDEGGIWDGTTWTPVAGGGSMGALACTSPTRCVGFDVRSDVDESDPAPPGIPTIKTWDGTSWTSAPTPTPEGETVVLFDVACATAPPGNLTCTAVGGAAPVGQPLRPVALVREGPGPWSIASLPDTGTGLLRDVACPTPADCLAIGPAAPGDPPASPGLVLARHDDVWQRVSGTTVGSGADVELRAVACRAKRCAVAADEATFPGQVPVVSFYDW
jgi:hypothetical protein